MATSATSTVYIQVIEDVINKVRDEFMINGPGDSVLSDLQGIWELKMMQSGAIVGPIDRTNIQKSVPGGPTPVHDLNVPYDGTDEYETPTADMIFPPTPLQTPLMGMTPTPLPGTAQTPLLGIAQTPLLESTDSPMYNIPTGTPPLSSSDYHSLNENGSSVHEKKLGRSPFMQPPSAWMNQRSSVGVDVNVAYVEGREELERGTSNRPATQDFLTGKRKRDDIASKYNGGGRYIPQQDGAGDSILDSLKGSKYETIECEFVGYTGGARLLSSRIPQLDGPIPDPFDDMLSTPNIYNYQGTVSEDYNIANTPAPHDQAPTPAIIAQNDVGDDDDDDDEPLNEDDDEDDLDDVDQGEDVNTQHLVLAKFEKVTRTKSRWKCTLKDGIMHLNNKDILFNKANGEFDF
ncbi:transcription initiation factor IIA large subunit-like [Impatiens glandulifera]|uniref:transcription initiation factor IIA large subunit-like n=1 Tax=Impatiens glandulifera TaxID=253017 RepID=UPI001FB0DC48|nr:transcription initiation factor IIA large subunit-like [Impatiens glandulifera]